MKAPVFLLFSFSLVSLCAQQVPQFTVAEVVERALSTGTEARIIRGNLDSAQAQFAQSQAGSSGARGTGLRLSAIAAYNIGLNQGDTVSTSGVAATTSVTTLPQTISGGLTLSGPSTDISLTETHTLNTKDSGDWGNGGSIGLTVNQSLWDGYLGGAVKARVDKAEIALQIASMQAQTSALSLVYSVKQSYYTMLAAQEDLSLLDNTLKQRQQFLKTVQAKFELKQATLVDLKTAQINARSSEIDLRAGRTALMLARIRLGNLMGLPDTQEFTIASAAEPTNPVPSLEQALSVALQNRSELKIAGLNRRSVQIDLELARGQAWPSVTVNGAASLNYDLAAGKAGSVFSAGVKVGMPLIDGGLLQQQELGSGALLSVYDLQLSQLRASISADIVEAYAAWQLSIERFALAQDTESQLLLQKEIAQIKAEADVINLSDLMLADVNFTVAQFARTKAKINSELAALQLVVKLGLKE